MCMSKGINNHFCLSAQKSPHLENQVSYRDESITSVKHVNFASRHLTKATSATQTVLFFVGYTFQPHLVILCYFSRAYMHAQAHYRQGSSSLYTILKLLSLVPRPIPSFSMLHAEKREGLVSEVTWGVIVVEQWLSCVGAPYTLRWSWRDATHVLYIT